MINSLINQLTKSLNLLWQTSKKAFIQAYIRTSWSKIIGTENIDLFLVALLYKLPLLARCDPFFVSQFESWLFLDTGSVVAVVEDDVEAGNIEADDLLEAGLVEELDDEWDLLIFLHPAECEWWDLLEGDGPLLVSSSFLVDGVNDFVSWLWLWPLSACLAHFFSSESCLPY